MSKRGRLADLAFSDKVSRLIASLELTEGVWYHGAVWFEPTRRATIGRDQGQNLDNWEIAVTPSDIDEEQVKLDPTFADIPLPELREKARRHLHDVGAKEPWGGWDLD